MSTPLEQTVAEVLGAHEISQPRGYAMVVCECGEEFWTDDEARAHVAAVLTRVVEAEVLEGAAETFDSLALNVANAPEFADWLRDRARVARGGGDG